MTEPDPLILSYASDYSAVGRARTATIFFRLALFFALFPMVIGIAITLCYLVVNLDWLPVAGFCMLFIGTGLVVVGLVCTSAWAILRHPGVQDFSAWKRWRPILLLTLLLLANFPIAFGCMRAGISIMQHRHFMGSD